MNQWVDEREGIQFQWPYLLAFLGGESRVTQLAYEAGAFIRRRKVESPSDLLRLILMWAVAERSLQETAALASEVDLADVSDVALLKRFSRAEAWLGALLGEVLAGREWGSHPAVQVRLVDATCISCRGSKTTERRVHLSLDLKTHRTTAIELTDKRGGERLDRFTFRPDEIVIGDRGYSTRSGLAHVVRQGARFIIRMAWTNVPLETSAGDPFDLLGALRSLPEAQAGEFAVQFRAPDGTRIPCRLIGIRKSEPASEHTRTKILADARRHNNTMVDLRTLEVAGYIFVLTNVSEEVSAEQVLALYRLRWQIELKFKTLKSVLHLGTVPTRSGALLNVYLLAKLLVAMLLEDLVASAESFSPWGYPIAAGSRLAAHAHSA